MRIKIITIILLSCLTGICLSQSLKSINQVDNQGKKQGHWIKKYQNGNVMYDGFFKNDYPTGEFKRFYENGVIKSVLVFSSDGKTAYATLYHPNGFKASEGRYVNQLKEGKWKFFSSFFEGQLISEEEYSHNRKQGLSIKYYPDSTIAEKQYYFSDLKDGEWIKYHPNGSLHFKTTYLKGRLNGKFEAFFDNGKPEVTGEYKNDLKDGIWVIYKEDGSIKFRIGYLSGVPLNRDIDIYETNYIDSLENLKIKIEDPEKTGAKW